ncbi:autophagy protein 5 isoform X1 [Folsomia candida]|uniref:autophagy protein 5 isoform X1 n=1 Tax=Folsomia candida TaxID=158441 RepID=UPI000B9086FA|nr:autophagy protein 5 isoform X1 [Folsomia candida]
MSSGRYSFRPTTKVKKTRSTNYLGGGGGGGGRLRMADDREVLREIWDSKLPVSFALAEEEVYTVKPPEPYYLMVPRLLYFPLVTDKVRRHFAQHVNPEIANNEMWLEYNGQPIKWNHPIGLWFDLFSDGILPWSISIHFDKFPEQNVCRCPCKDAIRSQFMSVLKEADALKHKGQVINSMQEKDHNQLWLGFQNDKFDQFWGVNKRLMESPAGEGFRNIPIRCYTPEKFAMQRLVKPVDDANNSWTSLHDALIEFFPDFDASKVRILIHGIEPPLNSPIQWLSEHLSYPDNFLHVVILPTNFSSVPS